MYSVAWVDAASLRPLQPLPLRCCYCTITIMATQRWGLRCETKPQFAVITHFSFCSHFAVTNGSIVALLKCGGSNCVNQ